MYLCAGSASAERVGQGEVDGGSHPQGDLHMLAVVAVYRNALVGTGWSPIGLENTALTLWDLHFWQ